MRPSLGRSSSADKEVEDVVVSVRRCSKTVKGGKRFSFSATVVVGDRKGRVGVGQGKAKEVPFAVEKGIKAARRDMVHVALKNTTIPHRVSHRYLSSTVILIPACQGTGIIAGASVRAVVEMAGIKDILTKVQGSTNPVNVVKATIEGLQSLRSKKSIEKLRGVSAV